MNLRFPFAPTRKREYLTQPMSADDFPRIADIHRQDFVRPWSEAEFDGLLGQDSVFGYVAREEGHGHQGPKGFVLARLAAGEGEILTVAVDRAHRRQGLGWKLMDAVLREMHAQRAQALFLEVDETNAGAIALYRRMGFLQVGRRPAYYSSGNGQATGALIMRRDLR